MFVAGARRPSIFLLCACGLLSGGSVRTAYCAPAGRTMGLASEPWAVVQLAALALSSLAVDIFSDLLWVAATSASAQTMR